jgi:hypothetical protein
VERFLLILLVLVGLTPTASLRGQPPIGWRGDGTGRYPDATPVLTWSPKKNVLWKTELPGGSPASPILVGDRVFVLSDPVVLLCVQAADGKVLWKRGHTASGKTVVLQPGREYKEVGVNELDYHPTGFAFAGKRIYVRTHQHLYCVGE